MNEIFISIVNYVNFLINHVKPKKRIFIAIDGVAPRAKMNNQRQRRYQSAKANKHLISFLQDHLETSPGVISFKNNSICPGTDFMMDLIDNIKVFILKKLQEDEQWRKVSPV